MVPVDHLELTLPGSPPKLLADCLETAVHKDFNDGVCFESGIGSTSCERITSNDEHRLCVHLEREHERSPTCGWWKWVHDVGG